MNEQQQMIRNELENLFEQKLCEVDFDEVYNVIDILMSEYEIKLEGKEKEDFIYAVYRG